MRKVRYKMDLRFIGGREVVRALISGRLHLVERMHEFHLRAYQQFSRCNVVVQLHLKDKFLSCLPLCITCICDDEEYGAKR